MNRFYKVDTTLDPRRVLIQKPAKRNSLGRASHQRFFIPLHYEKNYAYPLLIWLHGPTGSEFEVSQIMPHVSMRNYVAVSPRGPVRHSAVHPNGDPTFTWDQESRTVEKAMEDVLSCISQATRRFNIAPHRIFLAGNDRGGTMALRLAFAEPELFAGVASIGGSLPVTRCPLAKIDAARSLRVLLAAGRNSDQYSVDRVCDDLRLLHAAGLSVACRQYPCGHEVTTRMLSDLNNWMMEIVSGQPMDCSAGVDDPTHMRIQDYN